MLPFWQTIDLFGKIGAARAAWQAALGEDLDTWSPLLQARGTVDSMEDPDYPGQILELEKPTTGDFVAFSTAIPSHRPPLRVPRVSCVRLVPSLSALSTFLADKLGFTAAESPRWSGTCLHEIGTYHSGSDNPRPVHLFIPDSRNRHSLIMAGVSAVESAIVLLPLSVGFDNAVKALATRQDVHIRVLTTASGLHKLSIAPPPRRTANRKNPARTPIFTPKSHWQWRDLRIVIKTDGLGFHIHGEEGFRTWKELAMRPLVSGQPSSTLRILSDLANGRRISQKRGDDNERQQISTTRKFLTGLIPIHNDKPFKKFRDGWGADFRVDGSVARQQVATWEAEDDEPEEIRYDTPRSVLDATADGFHNFQT